MSWHIVQIQNDQISTYVHKRGSITIDLVLKKGISYWKCQTKEFDLIDNCQKGIITTSHNKRLIINNKKNTKPRMLTGMHGQLTLTGH